MSKHRGVSWLLSRRLVFIVGTARLTVRFKVQLMLWLSIGPPPWWETVLEDNNDG